MRLESPSVVSSDVLIIGGGGAGLRAAIEARKLGVEVLLACKSRAGYGNNTAISKGAFAAAVDVNTADSPEVHLRDTVIAGRFLNNQRLVESVVYGACEQVADLQSFGVEFNRWEGELRVFLVPGHTNPRHISCQRGLGIGLTLPMRAYAASIGVKFAENVLITRLMVEDRAVVGAVGLNRDGQTFVFFARSTIIACGGLGQIYLNTNNAVGTTGDGYTLAYDAGASLADMEFVQFYPTALGQRGARMVPYEAFVSYGGGVIRNSLGENVLEKYGLRDTLTMTRDQVSRAVMQEILGGRVVEGKLILDLSSLAPELRDNLSFLLPPKTSPQEKQFLVSPTTHYAMGGVSIGADTSTELGNLFAAGEICAGMHGANRLGGNAITEILVMGAIAGKKAAEKAKRVAAIPYATLQADAEIQRLTALGSTSGTTIASELREHLKETMWYRAGIIREKEGLAQALTDIDTIEQGHSTLVVRSPRELWEAVELGNMLTVSRMVCRAALERRESRGAHYRKDYPEENDKEWLKTIVISRHDGDMLLSAQPVELLKIAP